MPIYQDPKVNLLRRYLAANGITQFDTPISFNQGVELQRLQMLFESPDQFKKAVLEWEAEQREQEEDKRKQFLDQLEAERNDRFYNNNKAAEQIALARGKQAQKSNLELAMIKQTYDSMEEKRKLARIQAIEQQKREREENRRANELIQRARPENDWQEERTRRQIYEERLWREREEDFIRRSFGQRPDWRIELAGEFDTKIPQPATTTLPKQEQPDIPMAPDTKKRRIKLRD